MLCEELAGTGSGGLAAGIGAHTGIATPPIWKFGTPDQQQRWLVPAIRGEKIAALGITEPEAGSDVAGIRTVAKKVDGGYVVNGSKTYITNGVRADFIVTAVKTTEAGGHQGISFLVLEKGMEGFSVSKKLEKLGWHASDTAELAFADVFVPEENLLGEENRGFYLIMANFQWERLLMALGACGSMQHVLDRTLAYARERSAFGRPIGSFQALRHKLAQMAVKHETSRALTYHALRLFALRPGRATRGDRGQAAVPALGLRGRRRRGPDPRRRRLHEGVRGRAGAARHAPRPDRRRHRRDHEGDPRQAARALRRVAEAEERAADALGGRVRPGQGDRIDTGEDVVLTVQIERVEVPALIGEHAPQHLALDAVAA